VGKEEIYKLILKGEGLALERDISQEMAYKIVVGILGGNVSIPKEMVKVQENPAQVPLGGNVPKPEDFMVQKSPKTEIERVTCLAYYLCVYRERQQFKTKDLTELNREALQEQLTNPSAAARNATACGYLSLVGGGKKQITTKGKALVDALPDRDRAKMLIGRDGRRKKKSARKQG
jgi:hypothetical protein